MDFPISVPSVGLVGGKFVDEDPLAGTPGSLIPAQWGNAVTLELLNVITAAGLAPDEQDNTQLLSALRLIGRAPTLLVDTGAANAYTAANSPALTALPATGYMQKVRIGNANTGASTYAPDGLAARPIYGLGLQPLQGGEIPAGVAVFMYLVQAGVNSGNGAWILIESLGGAQQIPNGTKSHHAVATGQVPTETVGGSALVATQSLVNAGVDDATVVTPKKLRAGFSISLGINGYIAFPTWMGGLIIQWGQSPTAVLAGGGVVITLPIAFPNNFYRGIPFYDLAGSTSVDVTTLVLHKASLSSVKVNNTSSNTTTPSFIVWGN